MFKITQLLSYLTTLDELRARCHASSSSETQGQLVGTGKSLKRAKKNSGEEKSRTQRRALLCVLDFSSPEFFFARFRLFPVPTNCPWVSEDGCHAERRRSIFGAKLTAWRHKICHIFNFLQSDMVFEIVSHFLCIFNSISSEKRGLISVPFLTC